jgi:hypothetical protein
MLKNHWRIVEARTVNKGCLREETPELRRTTVCSDVKSPDIYVFSADYSSSFSTVYNVFIDTALRRATWKRTVSRHFNMLNEGLP